MGTPTGAVSVESAGSVGVAFFVFDRSALKKETDKIEDAVKYYYPKDEFRLEKVKEKCRQLVGMSDCVMDLTGRRPQVFRLKKEKYVLKQEGDYGIVLAGRTSDSDLSLVNKLKRLYDVFVFYHGSLHHVHQQMEGDNKCFIDKLHFIWSNYYELRDDKHLQTQNVMFTIFRPLSYVDLPKTGCQFFVKASQILQSCQRQKSVLAGCIVYQGGVLYTQLSPALTEKLLVCAAKSPSEGASTPKRTGFCLPEFIQLYSLYLTKDEYQQLLSSSPENTEELIIPPIAGDSLPLQPPLYASQLSREEKARTASASSIGSSGSSSSSVLSRFSRIGSRSISPEKQRKCQPHVEHPTVSPLRNNQPQTSNSLLHGDLKDKNKPVAEGRETNVSNQHGDETGRNAVTAQRNSKTSQGRGMTSVTVFSSESEHSEMSCDKENCKHVPLQFNSAASSSQFQSSANSSGTVATGCDESDSTLSNCLVDTLSSSKSQQFLFAESAKTNPHGTNKKRLSVPNMSQTITADCSTLSSSLKSQPDFSMAFDANLLSAGSSYGSIVSTEEHVEHAETTRAHSTDSADSDSIYLDCRPGQDSSSSPSPQFTSVQSKPSNSSQLHEGSLSFEKRVSPIIRKKGETRAVKQSDMVDVALATNKQRKVTESGVPHENFNLSNPTFRRESVMSDCSYTAPLFSEIAADDLSLDEEEIEDEDVEDMVSATLYIQASVHSNLVLLLVAGKHLEREKETVHCLWEHSLPQLADLAINLKESVSRLSPSKAASSFYYTVYNSYEKTMSTNCKQATTHNAKSFVRVIKAMQKQYDLNPNITDVVLRYPVTCSAYARFSLGKEIYFQSRGGQPSRLVAPPGTPEMRDITPTKEAVGFNIEMSARTKLCSEAGVNLI